MDIVDKKANVWHFGIAGLVIGAILGIPVFIEGLPVFWFKFCVFVGFLSGFLVGLSVNVVEAREATRIEEENREYAAKCATREFSGRSTDSFWPNTDDRVKR